MSTLKKPCLCGSGQSYGECCAPHHKLAKEAPDAEVLMRSRYSAYALREVDYLWHTLHSTHPERRRGREAFRRSWAGAAYRYMGLVVYDWDLVSDVIEAVEKPSKVLFLAKVFRQGKNVSFIELSEFLFEEGGFRYTQGRLISLGDRAPPSTLSIQTFLRGFY